MFMDTLSSIFCCQPLKSFLTTLMFGTTLASQNRKQVFGLLLTSYISHTTNWEVGSNHGVQRILIKDKRIRLVTRCQ